MYICDDPLPWAQPTRQRGRICHDYLTLCKLTLEEPASTSSRRGEPPASETAYRTARGEHATSNFPGASPYEACALAMMSRHNDWC
jgi:hypothetical protein